MTQNEIRTAHEYCRIISEPKLRRLRNAFRVLERELPEPFFEGDIRLMGAIVETEAIFNGKPKGTKS